MHIAVAAVRFDWTGCTEKGSGDFPILTCGEDEVVSEWHDGERYRSNLPHKLMCWSWPLASTVFRRMDPERATKITLGIVRVMRGVSIVWEIGKFCAAFPIIMMAALIAKVTIGRRT